MRSPILSITAIYNLRYKWSNNQSLQTTITNVIFLVMDYLTQLANHIAQAGGQAGFARALGISQPLVSQLLVGKRPGPRVAVAIEQYTGGQVGRRDFYPHDWREIWPELSFTVDCRPHRNMATAQCDAYSKATVPAQHAAEHGAVLTRAMPAPDRATPAPGNPQQQLSLPLPCPPS